MLTKIIYKINFNKKILKDLADLLLLIKSILKRKVIELLLSD